MYYLTTTRSIQYPLKNEDPGPNIHYSFIVCINKYVKHQAEEQIAGIEELLEAGWEQPTIAEVKTSYNHWGLEIIYYDYELI